MASIKYSGLVSLGGTGRDDISMQFASRDFRPCWIYTWVAIKLPPAIFNNLSITNIFFNVFSNN